MSPHVCVFFVRIGLLVFILIACLPAAKAQKIKIGFRGGASFANFFNHNASGEKVEYPVNSVSFPTQPQPMSYTTPAYPTNFFKDMRTGFFSGLYLDLKLNEKWTIETGLGYTQKGINLEYSSTYTTVNDDNTTTVNDHQMIRIAHTNYITIPGVFKYTVGRKQRFYVLGGLYHAIALNSKIKAQDNYTEAVYTSTGIPSTSQISESHITKADYHILDFGLVGGGGFEIPIKNKWSAGIDVRMNMGLINVPANYAEFGYITFSATTKNVNIETGIRISYVL